MPPTWIDLLLNLSFTIWKEPGRWRQVLNHGIHWIHWSPDFPTSSVSPLQSFGYLGILNGWTKVGQFEKPPRYLKFSRFIRYLFLTPLGLFEQTQTGVIDVYVYQPVWILKKNSRVNARWCCFPWSISSPGFRYRPCGTHVDPMFSLQLRWLQDLKS